ncbi:MAG: DUF898 family protein [Paracoccaceae bacterium]
MSSEISGIYHGQKGALFGLYLRTALLTLVTFGFYRFWAKTRIRTYIWSATTGDGDGFEYTGTGLEKFLGFLFAIIVLAIYLGLIQMVLFYFGIFLFRDPETQAETLLQMSGIYVSVLAVLPLYFFASYRARRYRMARTRWRGVRFGMEKGAWGYVWRAILYLLLSIISLGLFAPLQTFRLEKYMTDRTWFGDARFEQKGSWTKLYPAMKHILIASALIVGATAAALLLQSGTVFGLLVIIGVFWFAAGIVYYRVTAFNYLTCHKVLDETISMQSDAKTGTVLSTYVVGGLIISGLASVGFGLLAVIIGTVLGFSLAVSGDIGPDTLQDIAFTNAVFGGLVSAALYVAFVLILGGISLVLITQAIIAHVVGTIRIQNSDHLDTIQQRAADLGADAEGFADALDIGAAI